MGDGRPSKPGEGKAAEMSHQENERERERDRDEMRGDTEIVSGEIEKENTHAMKVIATN